jgi:hypothetical protein
MFATAGDGHGGTLVTMHGPDGTPHHGGWML